MGALTRFEGEGSSCRLLGQLWHYYPLNCACWRKPASTLRRWRRGARPSIRFPCAHSAVRGDHDQLPPASTADPEAARF